MALVDFGQNLVADFDEENYLEVSTLREKFQECTNPSGMGQQWMENPGLRTTSARIGKGATVVVTAGTGFQASGKAPSEREHPHEQPKM